MGLLAILWAFLVVGVLGALFGIGLAFASRLLFVAKDKRVEEAAEALPGLNCGSCGYAGCDAYAEAVVAENEEVDLCKPGGQDTLEALGRIMGVAVESLTEKLVARCHCGGGYDEAVRTFDYSGLEDCNAANALYGGGKACPHGCLGLGSCVKVCPVDAIAKTPNGLVEVDRDVCISCGKCVDICPTGVMKMVPYNADYVVACNSTDKGAAVRKYCSVGCIGCKRCVKASPDGGFVVENFLASIDYRTDGGRADAADKCPTNCIVELVPGSAAVQTPTRQEEEPAESAPAAASVESDEAN